MAEWNTDDELEIREILNENAAKLNQTLSEKASEGSVLKAMQEATAKPNFFINADEKSLRDLVKDAIEKLNQIERKLG